MATYSDPAPAAEAGTEARAGSRRARDRPRGQSQPAAGGVCAKRARVSVRRDTREAAAGGQGGQGVVGGLGLPPRHFRLRSRRDGVGGGGDGEIGRAHV